MRRTAISKPAQQTRRPVVAARPSTETAIVVLTGGDGLEFVAEAKVPHFPKPAWHPSPQ